MKKIYKEEDIQLIKEQYLSGKTIQKIRDEFFPNVNPSTIRTIIIKNFPEIMRKPSKPNPVFHNYFETIDTEEKAYFLGLLFADGGVQYRRNGIVQIVTLGLNSKDLYMIEKFAKAVNFLNPIKFSPSKNYQGEIIDEKGYCYIQISSHKMFSDLGKYGLVPKKSLIVERLPDISHDLLHHMIRGFFDGNGTVYLGNNKRGKHNWPFCRFGFYSTYSMIKYIQNILAKEINLPINVIAPHLSICSTLWSAQNDVKNFYDFLYKDATIYLYRKKEKFQEFFNLKNIK